MRSKPPSGIGSPGTSTLTEIRRQADADFIEVLRARVGTGGRSSRTTSTAAGAIQHETDDHFDGPDHRRQERGVDRYNALGMAQLPGARWASPRPAGASCGASGAAGEAPADLGHPEDAGLKIGALVMVLANDARRRAGRKQLLYVNGDLGTVVDARTAALRAAAAHRRDRRGRCRSTRQVKIPIDRARRTELRKAGRGDLIDGKWEIVGEITYMPLRVAYASHRAQEPGAQPGQGAGQHPRSLLQEPGDAVCRAEPGADSGGAAAGREPAAIIERCVTDPRLRAWL